MWPSVVRMVDHAGNHLGNRWRPERTQFPIFLLQLLRIICVQGDHKGLLLRFQLNLHCSTTVTRSREVKVTTLASTGFRVGVKSTCLFSLVQPTISDS